LTKPATRRRPLRLGAALCMLGLHGVAAQATGEPAPAPQTAHSMQRTGSVEVWVDLDLPPLARLQHASAAEQEQQRERIRRQQDGVMTSLRELGAVEQGRVHIVRNAVAVRLPAESLAVARQLPGVSRVTPVRHLKRPPDSAR